MKPVLLAYSGPGEGHRMAAMAIREALHRENARTVCLDTLTTAMPFFRFLYAGLYRVMARHAHLACERVYRLTDLTRQKSPIIRAIDWWSLRNTLAFQMLVKSLDTGLAICTHFLPMALLSLMRDRGDYTGRIHVVITDYDLHGFWVDSSVDHYHVASVQVRDRLAAKGIPDSRISITGIPVRESFTRLALLPRREPSLPLRILFLPHSIAQEQGLNLIDSLVETGCPVHLSVVDGASLRETRPDADVKWLKPTADLAPYMAEADLLIAKPGGLVCSEALSAGLPMIFTSPIPMQETLNAIYLQGQGTGTLCETPEEIRDEVRRLAADPRILRRMGHACQRMSSPGAAGDIARHALGRHPGTAEWHATSERLACRPLIREM